MLAYCVYVSKVASIDGVMHFLVACHCTIFYSQYFVLFFLFCKGTPNSITERRVPELIPVLGSQPAGDVIHKPGSRLPLFSARPAVTLATLERAANNFAAW